MSTRLYQILNEVFAESGEFRYSDKYKGAGYHSVQGGNHTVIAELNNFIGTMLLQGTLVELPGEYDWIDIANTTIVNEDSSTMSSAVSRNFQGNFVWIRAKYLIVNGSITKIQYNY